MRTVVRCAVSPKADDGTVSAPNQRSRVSFIAFFVIQFYLGTTSDLQLRGQPLHQVLPMDQTSNFELFRTASAAVTSVFGILIPVSEEKFLCANCGWRTKSCTHTTSPFTFSWSIATPFSDTVKTGCNSEAPITTNSLNWKICEQNTY